MNTFRGLSLPKDAKPAGYSWLIESFALKLPARAQLSAIAGHHRPQAVDGWLVLPERYAPVDSLGAQLAFALKWEGVDLAVLDALFRVVPASDIAAIVRETPAGAQTRRLWFLYEWLRDSRLDLPDAEKVTAVNVVDPKRQFALRSGAISTRHRVRNNLPGTPAFCPMVRRTAALDHFAKSGLDEKVQEIIGKVHPDLLTRAAAFLLLSDSRASYRIEGEAPSPDRARRWAQTIESAGVTALSIESFEALQRVVIGDARFVRLGLRTEGGFIGERDRQTQAPIPHHISARPDDLRSLMHGLAAYDQRSGLGEMDAVVAAAVEAFGFVYVHPFKDGNGRIHRWLLHHVLAASGFAPSGVVFPISAVILREIAAYRRVLESYSRPLLECIDWRATPDGNVEVLNETASWYRYFDATPHAEFVYRCVEATITFDLPFEVAYLRAFDRFVAGVSMIVDMPQRTQDLLHQYLRQNDGRLSERAREREFAALTDDEAARIEALYAESVADLPPQPAPIEDAHLTIDGE